MSLISSALREVEDVRDAHIPRVGPSGKFRVLLVDDHPITRHGFRAVVDQQLNLEVCGEAANAAEALRMIETLQPHLVVVDISLGPPNNGIELTRDIKTRAPHLPVLVVSMHEEMTYAERALRAGARGYLMKQEAGEKFGIALQQLLRGEVFLSARMQERMAKRFVPKRRTDSKFAFDTLSERERQVFDLIGDGYSTRQIADKLSLSAKTVDSYREHLKLKLGFESGADLVRHAIDWRRTGGPL